jgi:hypothetical protein
VQTDLLFQGSLTKLRNNFQKQIVQIKSGVIQTSDSVSNSLAGRTLSEIEKWQFYKRCATFAGTKPEPPENWGSAKNPSTTN